MIILLLCKTIEKKILNKTDDCTKINTTENISCKKIYGYNVYFINKK